MIKEFEGNSEDGLRAGLGVGVMTCNIYVANNAKIERGMLLGSVSGIYDKVENAADADKTLVIAAQDYTADSLGGVVTAYTRGLFNREKIKLGGSSTLTIDSFENSLRHQGIYLTSRK